MNPRFMASQRSCAERNQGLRVIDLATKVSGFI